MWLVLLLGCYMSCQQACIILIYIISTFGFWLGSTSTWSAYLIRAHFCSNLARICITRPESPTRIVSAFLRLGHTLLRSNLWANSRPHLISLHNRKQEKGEAIFYYFSWHMQMTSCILIPSYWIGQLPTTMGPRIWKCFSKTEKCGSMSPILFQN